MDRLEESVWFEIFRCGIWHGFEYKKDDLDKIIENFEKGDPQVPLIIGHNSWMATEEKPAHGWVSKLKRQGNRLMAKASQVSAELVTAVNERIYPMRSVELWFNYHERGLALGAIAFLGGSNPEVGGMADFTFSANRGTSGIESATRERDDGEQVCLAFRNHENLVAAGATGNSTHHKGGDDMTKEEIEALLAGKVAEVKAEFSAQIVNLQAENAQLKTQLAESNQHAAAIAVKADLESCQAFAKKLLDDKQITPAQFNSGVAGFLLSLDDSETVEFTQGKPQTRRAFAKEFLGGLQTNKGLFGRVAESTPESEQAEVPASIEAFAKKEGLDPKLLEEQYRKQMRPATSED